MSTFAAGTGIAEDPFTSVEDAYNVPSAGRYHFNTGVGIFQADVDTSEGGGWILVLQYVHKGGTNPPLAVIGAGSNLPVTSTASLGADESSQTARWGNAGNLAMSQFGRNVELRWFGETSAHTRQVHFRSTVGDDYVRTGIGSFSGINSDFTALAGHTANIPAAVNSVRFDKNDAAMTEFPFFRTGNFHWGIKGNDDRWEVDDFHDNESQDTIHRVWVRASNPLQVTNKDDSGAGSLRNAIAFANANSTEDDITFNIPGLGPHVISPTSALPTLTDDGISIDGSTQGSVVCNGTPNAEGGMSNRKHYIVLLATNHSDHALNISGASNVTIKGLTIGDSDQNGLNANNADGLTLLCNHFGTSTDTTNNIGNVDNGVEINSSDNVIIGDGTLSGANIAGFNGNYGIFLNNGSNNATLKRYFVGIAANSSLDIGNGSDGIKISNGSDNSIIGDQSGGGNIVSGNRSDGIDLQNLSGSTILGNYIGSNGIGTVLVANDDDGINLVSTSSIRIGNGTSAGQNIVVGSVDMGILFLNASGEVNGNLIGIGSGNQSIGNRVGIQIIGSSSAQISSNIIANSQNNGVEINNSATAAIYENSIYDNGELGIDVDADGQTDNDTNDTDSGSNDRLNFPIINAFRAGGTTSVSYDINLDVPSNPTDGYRIEFFKNTAADPTGYGEGEIYLGTIDIAAPGNHIGSLTTTVTVDVGDIISATTTRKTGALTYDITSEFSENSMSTELDPATLSVIQTVTNLNSGKYSTPGNDMVYTLSVVNEGNGSVTADSIVLIQVLPAEVRFFNGDHDGLGPSTAVIGFEETGTSLTFDPAVDALYSDAATKPSGLSECDYTPASGYDINVNFICLNPKGIMLGGDPDPSFNISFRVGIN